MFHGEIRFVGMYKIITAFLYRMKNACEALCSAGIDMVCRLLDFDTAVQNRKPVGIGVGVFIDHFAGNFSAGTDEFRFRT